MNAWRLNGLAGHYFRTAIANAWKIPLSMIYKQVHDITNEGHIVRRDGKVFKLTLTEITDGKG
jgi:hypothetical protein